MIQIWGSIKMTYLVGLISESEPATSKHSSVTDSCVSFPQIYVLVIAILRSKQGRKSKRNAAPEVLLQSYIVQD